MSALTDKYGPVYILAEQLGGSGLAANEDNGHLTISGQLPTKYDVNQVWDKAKEIDPGLDDGDLTLSLTPARSDIYGEHEIKPGENLTRIAQHLSKGKLTPHQLFEANRHQLDDPDKIRIGQKIIIPNFE
ncbi:MAG: LysM peptidoglycan-binding domain-containing protein [Acidobacteria bacterium]|nr:LysM peptidoglycan-binding domain-containing protein [Acidobacteriota bacterium]